MRIHSLTNLCRFSIFASAFCISACSPIDTKKNLQPQITYERLNAILWMQTSAEYYALTQNAYTQATSMLSKGLADKNWTAAQEQTSDYQNLPPAIILDIDETVLDNSPFQAQLIKDNAIFTQEAWDKWTQLAAAQPLPGAKAFLDYADSQGVTIFYVTNREASQEQDTRKNLKQQHLPLRDDIDVVLTKNENRWNSSDKGARRTFVSKNFRIIALIGDDFGDFVSGAKSTPETRVELAKNSQAAWGTKWFLIPNPVYGSWEAALFNHDYAKPASDVTDLKLLRLKGI
jgi:5'-nucleotidase (lipoprotein e(P4) family)